MRPRYPIRPEGIHMRWSSYSTYFSSWSSAKRIHSCLSVYPRGTQDAHPAYDLWWMNSSRSKDIHKGIHSSTTNGTWLAGSRGDGMHSIHPERAICILGGHIPNDVLELATCTTFVVDELYALEFSNMNHIRRGRNEQSQSLVSWCTEVSSTTSRTHPIHDKLCTLELFSMCASSHPV